MNLIGLSFKTVLWTVIIVAFLYNFLTHFILWIELRLLALANNSEQTGPTASHPWSKLLKSFATEFGCTILSIVLYPLRFVSKTQKQTRNVYSPSALPVLFVHGYLHNQTAWLWFTSHLQKKPKMGPIYSINLFPPIASISELAEQLKDKINDIQVETGFSQVILIGHSMGGIVSSYYCEFLAKSKEVAMVVTLGTPFNGTRVAALGVGQGAKEIAPHSPFLRELSAKIQQSEVPYYSIASKIDNIVIPWQSALLSDESATRTQLILEDCGHLRLLFSPLVIEKVAEWISTGNR